MALNRYSIARDNNRTTVIPFPDLTDGRTFDFDLKSGILPPNTTFARASTATYMGSDGLLKTAQIDEPRFEYDSLGQRRGLLIEQGAANVINWSESFATSGGVVHNWADTNIARDSTTAISPAGTATALQIRSTAANGSVVMTSGLSSSLRMVSIWIKRISGTGNVQFTLNGGTSWTTISTTFSNSTSWIRWNNSITQTMTRFGIRLATSGDVIQIWGAQAEANRVTSYIPTGSSQATRSTDFAEFPIANQPWLNSNAGTFCVSASRNSPDNTALVFALEDESFNYLHSLLNASSLRIGWSWPSEVLQTVPYGLAAVSTNLVLQPFVSTISYLRNPSNGIRDWYYGTAGLSPGETSASDSLYLPHVSDAAFAEIDAFGLGCSPGGVTVARLNGHIRRIAYWPAAFPNGIGTTSAEILGPTRSLLYDV